MTDKKRLLPFIEFAQELTDKYDWSENSARDLRRRLRKITNKQLDDRLNLSVVGEFSIGKSSFISSLIRRELLESAALQGTTVASTILDYSPILSLVINFKDGRSKRFEFADDATLREYLSRYSSDPDYAVDVDSLFVTFPSENLKKAKIRIIDTPGTNSLEMWHEETTIHAINELSDASIVLIDATKPLPESQKAFIRNNLEDVLDRCAFIVTKIDLLRPRERERMLQYVRGLIEYEFSIENPLVISYSSLCMMNYVRDGDDASESDKAMAEELIKNEKLLFDFIAAKKSFAQAKKITALLEDMYEEIGERMPLLSKEYERRHEVLERTKNTDMSVFISEQIKRRAAQFYAASSPLRRDIIDEIFTPILECKLRILNQLDSLKTKDEIKQFAQFGFMQMCRSSGFQLLSQTEAKCAAVRRIVAQQLEAFRKEFTSCYKRLGLLAMPVERAEIKVKYVHAGAVRISSADVLLDAVTGRNKHLLHKLALISPIKMKEELKQAIQEPMNDYFACIARMYRENVDKYISDLSLSVGREINRYYRRYNDFISEKIAEDEQQKLELEQKLSQIRLDVSRITETREKLREL